MSSRSPQYSVAVTRLDDPDLVAREYSTVERLSLRRLDSTGWLNNYEPIVTLLRAIAEVTPDRVLDAGCGDGQIAALVSAREVVCVDQSEAAVKAVRARGLQAEQAEIAELPFDDDRFDLVMCNWTLYHLPDLDGGLAEIVRVLRPGGRFVGCYNRERHLHELWAAVEYESAEDAFNAGNGGDALARHFPSVERRDTDGEVMWESPAALGAYLDAFAEMIGPLTAPAGPYPFRASRRNCVFVADQTC